MDTNNRIPKSSRAHKSGPGHNQITSLNSPSSLRRNSTVRKRTPNWLWNRVKPPALCTSRGISREPCRVDATTWIPLRRPTLSPARYRPFWIWAQVRTFFFHTQLFCIIYGFCITHVFFGCRSADWTLPAEKAVRDVYRDARGHSFVVQYPEEVRRNAGLRMYRNITL